MGINKHTRELIAGQQRTMARHEQKIQDERRKPTPNFDSIRQWEREIDNARKRVRKLMERLER